MVQYNKNIKNKKKGFTLVELMVVLAITAILAVLVGGGLIAYTRLARFEKNEANARTLFQTAQISLTRMETAGELLHRQETARSDEAARRMINRYVAGQAVRMVAESTVETEKVRLTPVLQWGYRQAELTFLVGGARPYVIKDLTKFYNEIKDGR